MKINITNSGKKICWSTTTKKICKEYQLPIIDYEILPKNNGIIILEPFEEVGAHNAVIYGHNGHQKWKLPFPDGLNNIICFDRVGFSNGVLNVIAIAQNRDVRLSVDFENYKYNGIFSSR